MNNRRETKERKEMNKGKRWERLDNLSDNYVLQNYKTTSSIQYLTPDRFSFFQVFIGSGDGRILALNQTDGSTIWSPATGDFVVSSVAVSRDNIVYSASTDKSIFALNGEDGSIIWSYNSGAAVVATPVLPPEQSMPIG